MTVFRSFDAERLNEILNIPEVHKWAALPDQKELDVTPLIENRDNYLLMAEDKSGGILFEKKEVGMYEVHTQFDPKSRGTGPVRAVKEMLGWMFANTDAVQLVTRVSVDNKPAYKLAEHFSNLEYVHKDRWIIGDESSEVHVFTLRLYDWIRNWKDLSEEGKEFHDDLELMLGHKSHEDDLAHDRWVGACVQMIRGGQVHKGVAVYNNWTVCSGYEPIKLISSDPVVLDMRSGIVVIRSNGTFDVVRME